MGHWDTHASKRVILKTLFDKPESEVPIWELGTNFRPCCCCTHSENMQPLLQIVPAPDIIIITRIPTLLSQDLVLLVLTLG